jgi:cobalt/nickel transport system permease protein
MILLMATTRFSELLKALERLKIPALITMILSFMYRYIFVVQDELMKMKQAKDARCVRCSRAVDIKTLSHMIGVLFIRAYERAESVYLTMCSRGFDGRTRTLTEFKLNAKDWFFSLIMALLLIGIRLQGR